MAPASGRDPQDLGRLGPAELLEMPQREDLAVDRVEAVERLLDPEEPLGGRAACVGEVSRPSSIEASAAELASGSGSR